MNNMKPVYQTMFGKGEGNCFPACIASILEIPLEEVPHFYKEDPKYGFLHAAYFLLDHGWNLHLHFAEGFSSLDEMFSFIESQTSLPWIAGGPSNRNPEVNHAVIYQGSQLIHDPNPNKFGISKIEDILLLNPK